MRISLETISKKGRSFISTARDKIPTRLRGTKNKEEHKNNVPKGNQILPLNFDTPETPIQKPDILKKNNIQKSKDRLGRTKFSFKATINGTEQKLYIPKEFHSRPEVILASKERIEAFVEKIKNDSPEAKDAYIKNGKIFKKSVEEFTYTYRPNGIESDDVTERYEKSIDKQVK